MIVANRFGSIEFHCFVRKIIYYILKFIPELFYSHKMTQDDRHTHTKKLNENLIKLLTFNWISIRKKIEYSILEMVNQVDNRKKKYAKIYHSIPFFFFSTFSSFVTYAYKNAYIEGEINSFQFHNYS